jgi:hypothetical protein
MLQEFRPRNRPKETLGTGVNVCFQCEDALALYREFKSRGIQTRKRPFVGDRLWVVPVTDPDGYSIRLWGKHLTDWKQFGSHDNYNQISSFWTSVYPQ